MKINAELLNKNLVYLNKKLYNINLKINTLKLDDRISNTDNSAGLIKVEIISIEPKNKPFSDHYILIVNQNEKYNEMPFQTSLSALSNLYNMSESKNINNNGLNYRNFTEPHIGRLLNSENNLKNRKFDLDNSNANIGKDSFKIIIVYLCKNRHLQPQS